MDNKFLNKLSSLLFYTYIFIFIILVNPTYSQTGWYEQTLPVSGTIYDMEFLNSNTGFISMSTPAILKTTNGGNNWQVLNDFRAFDIDIIDSMCVFATGRRFGSEKIYRTFDLGQTWDSVSNSSENVYHSIHFFNRDTGLIGAFADPFQVLFRTTNGGIALENLITSTTMSFGKLFFLKEKIKSEYYGWNLSDGYMSKTTNSGVNWTTPTRMVNGQNGAFQWLNFVGSNIGWIIFDPLLDNTKIYKTQDGGSNWIIQYYDTNESYTPTSIEAINDQKVWAGNDFWKIIHATSNGGTNWGIQITPIFSPSLIEILDSLFGWVGYARLAHTTEGGGIITYIGIDPSNTAIPSVFELKQNYPNPFNPQTTIEFSIKLTSTVSLILYDVLGKEIVKLYDNVYLNTGNYRAMLDFSKQDLPSGAYFYTLKVLDKNSKQLYLETKRMIYVK